MCTDLLTIGDGTVIRKDSFISWLPGRGRRDPDRPGHPRQGRVRRREDGARHRHLDGRRAPSSATPRRCTPGRRCPTASAGTGPRHSAPTVDYAHGRARPPAAACGGPATPLMQLLTLLAAVPAAGVRRRGHAARRGPAASGQLLDSRDAGCHELGVLPRRPGRLPRALLRRRCSSACSSSVTVPRLLNLCHQAGQGLSACTASTTRSTGRSCRLTNLQVLHLPLR